MGGVGVDSDQFQPFIPYTLSLNHTPLPPPTSIPLLPPPPCILSLHPPITCHPKGGIQASSVEKNALKRKAGLLSVSLVCVPVCVCARVYVCAFVCVLGLNTLFVVCVRLCVRRGGEAIGGADGQLLCSLLYCVHIYSLSIFLSLSSTVALPQFFPLGHFSTRVFLLSLFFFPPPCFLFSPCSLFHSLLSCGRWQRGAAAAAPAAATEQKPECEQEMGRGEGGCGKRRRRRRRKEVGVRHMESLVKGPPQRECACACGSVMNRGGWGGAGHNGCPLRQRFDSNRQRRRETDRQISRQIGLCRMVQRQTWKWEPLFVF